MCKHEVTKDTDDDDDEGLRIATRTCSCTNPARDSMPSHTRAISQPMPNAQPKPPKNAAADITPLPHLSHMGFSTRLVAKSMRSFRGTSPYQHPANLQANDLLSARHLAKGILNLVQIVVDLRWKRRNILNQAPKEIEREKYASVQVLASQP